MENIRSFRELKVWIKAMDVATKIFVLTKEFPADEKYSLTDQIRRSSRSIAANISEAWRARRYPASFVNKLCIAESEAAETQTHLEIALRCKYMKPIDMSSLDKLLEEILAMLVKMSANPEKWTIRKNT
jgi:four helix bundle protein